ncbi:hypothetical protein DDB_G0285929 [Dictyostelium discoideum AX4]|uniref:Uncharacterized protein n=1 Tax=Dictyostelium discoideum TaxID=44689 RepID=Q54MI0_DICDI|nr:hypothetical protein DDB_G0285929 [Dictyostelium discoideum AX4]EAL64499.1 hypothetical protein DDB_G0285929 [Dictyostelium discoideum AX4]|eukprot:XP_638010.1 hypothetical protein DDB_G0285929 [Dictyostelium discoideum AX4]
MDETNLSTLVNSYFLGIDANRLREMISRTGKDMDMLPDYPTKARYVVEYALLFAFLVLLDCQKSQTLVQMNIIQLEIYYQL